MALVKDKAHAYVLSIVQHAGLRVWLEGTQRCKIALKQANVGFLLLNIIQIPLYQMFVGIIS